MYNYSTDRHDKDCMQPNNSIADDLCNSGPVYFSNLLLLILRSGRRWCWLAGPGGGRDAELSLIEFGDQRPIQVEMR